MIRTVLNVVSWAIMAGGLLIAAAWTLMIVGRSGGSLRGAIMDVTPGAAIALVTVAAGGVLQMLVSIDERLEQLNGRA